MPLIYFFFLQVVSGGVARNQALRAAMHEVAKAQEVEAIFPPLSVCTDNGVMIAWAGMEVLLTGKGIIDCMTVQRLMSLHITKHLTHFLFFFSLLLLFPHSSSLSFFLLLPPIFSGVILQDQQAIEQVQAVSRWPLSNNEDIFNTKYPDYVKLKRRALKAAPDFPDRYGALSSSSGSTSPSSPPPSHPSSPSSSSYAASDT